MPKNAQGSWVGKTSRPVFRNYQTAGMLAPQQPTQAPPPAPPSLPPQTLPPMPVQPAPITPLNLFAQGGPPMGGGAGGIGGAPGYGSAGTISATPMQPNEDSVGDEGRERLIRAIVNRGAF